MAIDFSTTQTGFAYYKNNEIVGGFIKGTKIKNAWERTEIISKAIIDIIKENGLKGYSIAIEKPINVRNKLTAITLSNCNGYFLGRLSKYTNGFFFVENAKWASYHLISGKRLDRKRQSIEIVKSMEEFKDVDVNDDMADAINILTYVDSLQ